MWSILWLSACVAPPSPGGGSGSPTGTTPPPAVDDADGDGAVAALDCDDLDPASAPGLPEVLCDGRDNDCAGDGDLRGDCDRTLDSADVTIFVPTGATASPVIDTQPALVVVPDLTGDGLPDLAATGFATASGAQATSIWSIASGSPAPAAEVEGAQLSQILAPGDVTGDGAPDLFAGDGLSGTALIAGPLAGVATTASYPSVRGEEGTPAVGDGPYYGAGALWDGDGDGAAELFNYSRGTLYWTPLPAGAETAPTSWVQGFDTETDDEGHPYEYRQVLGIVDLDGDGAQEFLVGTNGTSSNATMRDNDERLRVLRGTPSSANNWATEVANLWQHENVAWAWADFDADGHLDVAGLHGPLTQADTSGALMVAYGPFTLDGPADLADLAGLTLEGITGTHLSLIPDTTGDGAPEIVLSCDDRVLVASLAVRGRVAQGCLAGPGVVGAINPYLGESYYSDWFLGGDFYGDGRGDLVIAEVIPGDDGGGVHALRVWNHTAL